MTLPLAEWGTSLTERITAAFEAGDRERCRELIAGGDGRSRDLAHEFHQMHKGLGISVGVIADVMVEHGVLDERVTRNLLAAFWSAYGATAARVLRFAPPPDPDAEGDAGAWAAAVRELVRAVEGAFEADQIRRTATVEAKLAEGADIRGELTRKIDDSYRPLHDTLIDFMARAFSTVYELHGPERLLRMQEEVARGQRAGIDKWEAGGSGHLAAAFAHLLVQHLGEFTVREEPDRYVIEQGLCGSGGRLLRDGHYRPDRPDRLHIVSEAGPLTGGHDRLPAYCTHCPVWNTHAPTVWYGHPHVEFTAPARPDGSCTLTVPKFDL